MRQTQRAASTRWKSTLRAAPSKTTGQEHGLGEGTRGAGLAHRVKSPARVQNPLPDSNNLPSCGFPGAPGRPRYFHASVSRTMSLQPALGTRCFLASPPSPAGHRATGLAEAGLPLGSGAGAWSLQTCRVSGWRSGAQTLGLTACAGFNPGTFSKYPTPMPAPPRKGGCTLPALAPEKMPRGARRCIRLQGQFACLDPWPAWLRSVVNTYPPRPERVPQEYRQGAWPHQPPAAQGALPDIVTQVGLTASATTQLTPESSSQRPHLSPASHQNGQWPEHQLQAPDGSLHPTPASCHPWLPTGCPLPSCSASTFSPPDCQSSDPGAGRGFRDAASSTSSFLPCQAARGWGAHYLGHSPS